MLIARHGRLYIAHDRATGRITLLYSETLDGVKDVVLDTGGKQEYRPGQWIGELLDWFRQVQSIPIFKLHFASQSHPN